MVEMIISRGARKRVMSFIWNEEKILQREDGRSGGKRERVSGKQSALRQTRNGRRGGKGGRGVQ